MFQYVKSICMYYGYMSKYVNSPPNGSSLDYDCFGKATYGKLRQVPAALTANLIGTGGDNALDFTVAHDQLVVTERGA